MSSALTLFPYPLFLPSVLTLNIPYSPNQCPNHQITLLWPPNKPRRAGVLSAGENDYVAAGRTARVYFADWRGRDIAWKVHTHA